MSAVPITSTVLADALGCFWNAAIEAQHTGNTPVVCIAEGIQAVANRLAELTTDIALNDRDKLIVRAVNSLEPAEKMADQAITFIQSVCTQQDDDDRWIVEAHKLNDAVHAFRKASCDADAVQS